MVRRREFMGVELALVGGIDRRSLILLVRTIDAGPAFGAALVSLAASASASSGIGRGAAVAAAEL
jgi:hypothetical protein